MPLERLVAEEAVESLQHCSPSGYILFWERILHYNTQCQSLTFIFSFNSSFYLIVCILSCTIKDNTVHKRTSQKRSANMATNVSGL